MTIQIPHWNISRTITTIWERIASTITPITEIGSNLFTKAASNNNGTRATTQLSSHSNESSVYSILEKQATTEYMSANNLESMSAMRTAPISAHTTKTAEKSYITGVPTAAAVFSTNELINYSGD